MGAYSGLIDIFCKSFRCRGAVCIFSLMHAFLSKLQVLHKHHKVAPSTSNTLCYVTNKFTKKTTGCPCTSGSINVRSNSSICILVKWLTADACHINCVSNVYIVGTYITLPQCFFLFITMTVIILVYFIIFLVHFRR